MDETDDDGSRVRGAAATGRRRRRCGRTRCHALSAIQRARGEEFDRPVERRGDAQAEEDDEEPDANDGG